jgi:internalin A
MGINAIIPEFKNTKEKNMKTRNRLMLERIIKEIITEIQQHKRHIMEYNDDSGELERRLEDCRKSNGLVLDLSNLKLSDLSYIKEFPRLIKLDVSFTQVRNLAHLKNLTNLRKLDISHTQVNDLTPLKNLVNLEQLQFYKTQVSDLTPLTGLVNLQRIYINSLANSDLSVLDDLVNNGLKIYN